MLHIKKVVITGGPGSGKSTLINELMRRKYHCFEEISRDITLNAQKEGVAQLFISQPKLFSELLIKGRLKHFNQADKLKTNLAFFDRGVHDILAYMDYIGNSYPNEFIEAANATKYDYIFILKPYKVIYKTDNERYEDFNQALKIHEHLIATYTFFNYKLIDVPFDTVENRTDFILNTLNV